jgi:hypothetical protein
MGEMRNAYRCLVQKPEEKRPLERLGPIWEDNIRMDLREIAYEGMDCIYLAQEGEQWLAFMNTVLDLWVP